MIYVGIDVAKNKHDCFIISSEGEVISDVFTIENTKDGFESLMLRIRSAETDMTKVKAGLEATGHYSYNIAGYLNNAGVQTAVINPLYTSQCRKSISLRKTKTDKVDARTIASMLMSGMSFRSYPTTLYHNDELKSLTRYRFDKVSERTKLKQSLSRLVNILFPELEGLTSTLHSKAIYEMLLEYPDAEAVSAANLKRLTNILNTFSQGRFTKEKAEEIRNSARRSIGTRSPAKAFELRHVIKNIRYIDNEVTEIETEIKKIMDTINSPITSVPGIGNVLGAMILAETGDFSRFSSPDKLLAFAGSSPTTYQSGQIYSSHARMEKRGSKYLRWALLEATKHVCTYEPTFSVYLEKKRSEGKHYSVAITHAAKKLIRVLFHLELTGEKFISQPVSSKA